MPNTLLTEAIEALVAGNDLASDQTAAVLAEIMEGRVGGPQTAAFLIALRAKGETVDEIVGLARTMRDLADHVEVGRDDLVDTAGTGGGTSTFNISTTAALVAAGAGCAVAKHGNRSATSRCGSADLLEALDVTVALSPRSVAQCIDRVGFGFMFAPAYHQAMKHVVPVRRDLAVRTIFNLLGPLTNPAGARRQLLGVSDPRFMDVIAGALIELGCDRALVVSSVDGLDELSISAKTRVIEVSGSERRDYELAPEDAGVERAPVEELRGGEPADNASRTRDVLDGRPGPATEVVALNAGAAIYAAGRAEDIPSGVEQAREAIEEGEARSVLRGLVEATRELAPAAAQS